MDISIGQPMSDIHTWIYPWIYPCISISTATLLISQDTIPDTKALLRSLTGALRVLPVRPFDPVCLSRMSRISPKPENKNGRNN